MEELLLLLYVSMDSWISYYLCKNPILVPFYVFTFLGFFEAKFCVALAVLDLTV